MGGGGGRRRYFQPVKKSLAGRSRAAPSYATHFMNEWIFTTWRNKNRLVFFMFSAFTVYDACSHASGDL